MIFQVRQIIRKSLWDNCKMKNIVFQAWKIWINGFRRIMKDSWDSGSWVYNTNYKTMWRSKKPSKKRAAWGLWTWSKFWSLGHIHVMTKTLILWNLTESCRISKNLRESCRISQTLAESSWIHWFWFSRPEILIFFFHFTVISKALLMICLTWQIMFHPFVISWFSRPSQWQANSLHVHDFLQSNPS